jgi:hypothetical protein
MAKEILAVPEEYLQEVIDVIRAGLHVMSSIVKPETKEQLTKWCDDEQKYINLLS